MKFKGLLKYLGIGALSLGLSFATPKFSNAQWDKRKDFKEETEKSPMWIHGSFNNNDSDDFYERAIIHKEYNHYPDFHGVTTIDFQDNDDDNFHEKVRIFNYNSNYNANDPKFITIENFYFANFDNKDLGYVDYEKSKYKINSEEWEKYYKHPYDKNFGPEKNLERISSEENYGMSLEDLKAKELYRRVGILSNVNGEEGKLESCVKIERADSKKKYLEEM